MSSSPASASASSLTQTPMYGERAIAEAELICFDNPRLGRAYEISIELPEFTCKCPFSGYPDFAVLRLIYQPGPRVVELKAIKLYVNSYRDRSISHEEVTNRIWMIWLPPPIPSGCSWRPTFTPAATFTPWCALAMARGWLVRAGRASGAARQRSR